MLVEIYHDQIFLIELELVVSSNGLGLTIACVPTLELALRNLILRRELDLLAFFIW